MSTLLWISEITDEEILENGSSNGLYIELTEDFLYELFVNEEFLLTHLSIEEIKLIRPNWGQIDLKPATSLSATDWEEYLQLLQGVIKSGSIRLIDKFLLEKGISSHEMKDRAKSPQDVLRVVEKLMAGLRAAGNDFKFSNELKQLSNFLKQTIERKNRITIEFMD